MNGAATTVALENARAGMVLAADLCDDAGAVLLPAGATLSDASLKSLGRRGVESLSVQAGGGAVSAAERLRRVARLERLFRRCRDDGASGALFAQLLRYRQES